ncbi:MAG: biopolymer transporter ExbD [Planctomycetes bacterium]|nr:biopolymer transporter ExbD [Planctomycetota bacterium]
MRHEFADDEAQGGIDLLPLIDVVFLLLVFFLAATTFAREEVALDLRLPEAQSGSASAPVRQLVVQVFADGRLVFDGREVTLEGLRQKLAAAAARDREQPVVVRGDTAAQFGLGLQVLDACRLAKLSRVDFAALPSQQR